MSKIALVTGITGQDGAYLARLLLEKGYVVVGTYRRSSSRSDWRLKRLGLADRVHLLPMDMLEQGNIWRVIDEVKPDETYNLAAQSFVGVSFEQPIYTSQVNAIGPARMLEALREICPAGKFYQASTSEMFGSAAPPQSEKTPFEPRSPYGAAKAYAHHMVRNYREAHGLFACSGILFNHESPLRGEEFVTRKIIRGLAQKAYPIKLGNLYAKRDWGFAGDYVEGMWRMLQTDTPDDYVLATGQTTTVKAFADLAAQAFGLSVLWSGSEENSMIGVDSASGLVVFEVDPQLYRPAEVDVLCGDPSRAIKELGWQAKMSLPALVKHMADVEIASLRA